jgi:hypothetical protein
MTTERNSVRGDLASRREADSGTLPAMPEMMRPGRLAGQARGLLRCGMWAGPTFAATFLAVPPSSWSMVAAIHGPSASAAS